MHGDVVSNLVIMKTKSLLIAGFAVIASVATSLFAGGTLTPTTAAQQPIKINSHQANVTINNGFAKNPFKI